MLECIDSYFKSSYHPIEVIVVDNASNPAVKTYLPKKYPKVRVITNNRNLGAAEGRNIGLDTSVGEYILFSDDDAFCDKDMVKYLVEAFKKKRKAGIIQPLVYDKQKKNYLQGAGHDIDLTTGRIKAWGVREEDKGQYEGLRKVPMVGCVWMVRKEVFEQVGKFDAEYFIPYEDSDFCLRASNAGFEIYCYSMAKSWHLGLKTTHVHPLVEWLGITTPERSYRVARNKIIFMAKNSKFPNNLLFFGLFMPAYLILHSLVIMLSGRWDLLTRYWQGVISGIWYGIRRLFNKATIIILSFTDPLPWVLDKKTTSILDVGCGEGLPMKLIKIRLKIENSTGVDLFKPYIEKGRQFQIHDNYKIQDIRKINFKNRSYDTVIASHVLEHLPKDDALNLLQKIEKIASRQIIIACPIGQMYHPETDGNKLQLHLSAFEPEEFEKRGYKIIRYGFRWLLGEGGIMESFSNIFITEICFTIHLLFTPIFYIFPNIGSYTFVAYKKCNEA